MGIKENLPLGGQRDLSQALCSFLRTRYAGTNDTTRHASTMAGT